MSILSKLSNSLKAQPMLWLSLAIYHLLIIALVIINFPFNKWFLGWDAVLPELNFALNWQRAIFAGWQENYGLGLLGGHGFAATLPHTLVTFILSWFLPDAAIRSSFTFLSWYLAGLGLFFLARLLLTGLARIKAFEQFQLKQLAPLFALPAAFYYLFNLATIQIFSIQLEAFVIHFAALPWLFWALFKLLGRLNKKNLLLFATINFLASGQAFIPSLFVTYAVALAIILLFYLLRQKVKITAIKKFLLIIFLTFLCNAYWLLPFTYYTLTRSSDFPLAYNNLISTPDMEDKSYNYGTLDKVALLKGFYWESYELGTYVEQPWRDYQQHWPVQAVGYAVFALALLGVILSWRLFKDWRVKALSIVALYFLASLAVATPPFTYLTELLRQYAPILAQAFRSTFTKLALGTAFSFSLFFAFALFCLFFLFSKQRPQKSLLTAKILSLLATAILVFYSWPLFQGKFLFNKMLIDLPQAYLDVIAYFKTQPDGRIADFPQNCAEGWYGYNWDYFGSGFLWYGVRQPFMSRSFDVWSAANENYHWQIERALNRQDYQQLEQILAKYDIKWILFDPNIIHCQSRKSIFGNEEFLQYLLHESSYQLVETFNSEGLQPIQLFARDNATGYLSIGQSLLNIGPAYQWTDADQAVNSLPYITDEQQDLDRYYPFRELFNKRVMTQPSFLLTETDDSFIFTSSLPSDLSGYHLQLPAVADSELLPLKLSLQPSTNNQWQVFLTLELPSIMLDEQPLTTAATSYDLGSFSGDSNDWQVYINGLLSHSDNNQYWGTFSTKRDNSLFILDRTGQLIFTWDEAAGPGLADFIAAEEQSISLPVYQQGKLQVLLPKVAGLTKFSQSVNSKDFILPVPCDEQAPSNNNKFEINEQENYLRLISQRSQQCLTVGFDDISTNLAYLLTIKARHQSGQQLLLEISSSNSPIGYRNYLQATSEFAKEYLILPPSFQNEVTYNLRFKNKSFSALVSSNDLAQVELWLIPYNFIKDLRLEKSTAMSLATGNDNKTLIVESSHPNPTFYSLNLDRVVAGDYLLLTQGYATGWLALSRQDNWPFFRLLDKQLLLNNWANAWQLQGGETTIYLFFWPQLLEYLGLAALVPTLIILLWPAGRKST